MKIEMVLISKDSLHIETLLKDGVSVYSTKTREEYLEKGFLVVDEHEGSEIIAKNQDIAYLKPWEGTTEDHFHDALEMLPPLKHKVSQGLEFFFSSEPYTGNIHRCFCYVKDEKSNENYFTALRRTTTSYDDMLDELLGR